MNRILILAAHCDDEILGCGGIISRFKNEGKQVKVKIFSRRGISIDQRFDIKPIVYWITKVEEEVKKFKPDTVFVHFRYDLNRDHQIISEAAQVACRPQSGVRELYYYEVLSSTELATTPFNPNTYITISNTDILYKCKEMVDKYSDELCEFPHPRSLLAIKALAALRGAHVHSQFAEAFVNIRRII